MEMSGSEWIRGLSRDPSIEIGLNLVDILIDM